MQKTVFLQSLHIILKEKISFDASQNVPSGRKQYSCNYCIDHFKTKFVLIHHSMSQHGDNSTLAITAFVTSKLNSFWFIREGPNIQTENSILAITAYNTSQLKTNFVLIHQRMSQHTENSILAITATRTFVLMHHRMFHQIETILWQLLHWSLWMLKHNSFDSSQNVPTCPK